MAFYLMLHNCQVSIDLELRRLRKRKIDHGLIMKVHN